MFGASSSQRGEGTALAQRSLPHSPSVHRLHLFLGQGREQQMRIGRLPGDRLRFVQGEVEHVLMIFAQIGELRLELILGLFDGGQHPLARAERDRVTANLVLANFLVVTLCVHILLFHIVDYLVKF